MTTDNIIFIDLYLILGVVAFYFFKWTNPIIKNEYDFAIWLIVFLFCWPYLIIIFSLQNSFNDKGWFLKRIKYIKYVIKSLYNHITKRK